MSPQAAAILADVIKRGRFAALKPAASRVYVVLLADHAPRCRFPLDIEAIQAAAGVCRKRVLIAVGQLYQAGLIVRWEADGHEIAMLTVPPPP